MKNSGLHFSVRALTMIEVLMLLAVVMLLAAVFLPRMMKPRAVPANRVRCANNLKQIGLAFKVWCQDNGDRFPMHVSVTNGGSMEFVGGPEMFRHFLAMSNELNTPKILFCRTEADPSRAEASTWERTVRPGSGAIPFTGNTNVSYFVGVDAQDIFPDRLLAGDRNIINGTAIRNGLLTLTSNQPGSWTTTMHVDFGNILMADGSVQGLSTRRLQSVVANSGIATNRLAVP